MIATELPDNPGTSVTNMAEQLASMVFRMWELDSPDRLAWIEHYPVESHQGSRNIEETFDLVTLHFDPDSRTFQSPAWRRLTPAELQEMTRERLSAA